ncbi:MAG: N-acetylmuramoyl-L-alanine amidase [Fimbriimonadaceae bacterium]|nr:N-acetylmuramoyl-L-alanine amidase [Fimbriimonadaceae bacterium]
MRRLFALLAVLSVVCGFGCLPSHAQTICIDPGHPSEVGRGASGKRITEIKAVWLVAVELQKLLEKEGYKVVLTKKSEDEFVRNQRRAEIANNAKADLLLRLHCDAAPTSGFASYYPSKQGTAKGKTGPSKDVIKKSGEAAKMFHPAAIKVLKGKLKDRGLKTDLHTAVGAKQGALTGSIFSKVPVILVEMAVLSNDSDDRFMSSKAGQQQMAKALLAGIKAAVPRKRA